MTGLQKPTSLTTSADEDFILDEESISSSYRLRLSNFSYLKDEVIWSLERLMQKLEVKYSVIEGRVKTLSSVVSKARRKKVADPLSEFGDLVGIRIILMFRADIEKVVKEIASLFNVISVDDKTGISVHEFGYMSCHVICSMPEKFFGPRYESIIGIKFEVQIRTISMHAWASISHYLDYKSDAEVPFPIRKSLSALSGLFYVADSMFESISLDVSKYRNEIVIDKNLTNKSVSPSLILDKLLDVESLDVYLRHRFSGREPAFRNSVKNLLEELIGAGFTTIADLDVAIGAGFHLFEKYERKHPPSARKKSGTGSRFNQVGVVRVILSICNDKYQEYRDRVGPPVTSPMRDFSG